MIYTNENYIPPVTYCEPNKAGVQRMNKQEAIEILKDERRVYIVDGRERKLDRALDMAIEALSAERTGEWVEDGYYDYPYYVCSNCGQECGRQSNGVEIEPLCTKYCPNCGARMGSEK